MLTFLKGIVVGIGGIAPGLSGSVMLVIFGLYKKTIDAIATIFKIKNLKKNLAFLVPLFLGFGVGILLFSKLVDFLLDAAEMQTRFAFLGLVIGTIPLFFKEVKKEGFSNRYYIVIVAAAAIGFFIFFLNKSLFPQITEPNLFQSVLLGVSVAGSSIVPGVDSAVILSSLGLYELYVSSIADLNFSILLPAALGLIIGALVISFIMNTLVKKFYTATFSVIFGLFISIIPSILTDSCVLDLNGKSVVSIILLIIGFFFSFFLGDVKTNVQRVKNTFKRK